MSTPAVVATSAELAARAVAAGEVVDVEPAAGELWGYLAVRGGIDVAAGARLAQPGLALGARAARAAWSATACPSAPTPAPRSSSTRRRRRVAPTSSACGPGRGVDWFVPDALDRLAATAWTVSADVSRVGVRLDGPPLERRVAGELPSEGLLLGAVQVPAGRPAGRDAGRPPDHRRLPRAGGRRPAGPVRRRPGPAGHDAALPRPTLRRGYDDHVGVRDMSDRLRFGIFMAPFHQAGENPTLAIERDLELVAHLDRLGWDEAWIGEHHSAGTEIIASPEIFIAAAAERTRHIKLGHRRDQRGVPQPATWSPSAPCCSTT